MAIFGARMIWDIRNFRFFLTRQIMKPPKKLRFWKNILSLIVRLMSSVKLYGCGKAQFNIEVWKTSNSKTKWMNRAIRSIAYNGRLENRKKVLSSFFIVEEILMNASEFQNRSCYCSTRDGSLIWNSRVTIVWIVMNVTRNLVLKTFSIKIKLV